MSHFNIHVFTTSPNEDFIESALDPYYEEREVDRYIDEEISAEDVIKAFAENRQTPQQTLEEFVTYWWYEDPVLHGDGSVTTYSTVNPDAKWDYWTIGGRWENTLLVKESSTQNKDNLVSQARIRDLDFDKLIAEQTAQAQTDYDLFEMATQHIPAPPSIGLLTESDGLYQMSIKEAREKLLNDPWVIAANNAVKQPDTFFQSFPHERFFTALGPEEGRKEYIAYNATPDVPLAWVDLNGEWHEQAQVLMFGVTVQSATYANFAAEYRDYVNSLDKGTYVSVVDCHT